MIVNSGIVAAGSGNVTVNGIVGNTTPRPDPYQLRSRDTAGEFDIIRTSDGSPVALLADTTDTMAAAILAGLNRIDRAGLLR